jgi:hypothetical protein
MGSGAKRNANRAQRSNHPGMVVKRKKIQKRKNWENGSVSHVDSAMLMSVQIV